MKLNRRVQIKNNQRKQALMAYQIIFKTTNAITCISLGASRFRFATAWVEAGRERGASRWKRVGQRGTRGGRRVGEHLHRRVQWTRILACGWPIDNEPKSMWRTLWGENCCFLGPSQIFTFFYFIFFITLPWSFSYWLAKIQYFLPSDK